MRIVTHEIHSDLVDLSGWYNKMLSHGKKPGSRLFRTIFLEGGHAKDQRATCSSLEINIQYSPGTRWFESMRFRVASMEYWQAPS